MISFTGCRGISAHSAWSISSPSFSYLAVCRIFLTFFLTLVCAASCPYLNVIYRGAGSLDNGVSCVLWWACCRTGRFLVWIGWKLSLSLSEENSNTNKNVCILDGSGKICIHFCHPRFSLEILMCKGLFCSESTITSRGFMWLQSSSQCSVEKHLWRGSAPCPASEPRSLEGPWAGTLHSEIRKCIRKHVNPLGEWFYGKMKWEL